MLKKWVKFLKSRSFLYSFAVYVGLWLLAVFIVSLSLQSYTRHGEALVLPNFSGLTIEEAQQKSEDADYTFMIIDSSYVPGQKPGVILDQSPKAGFKVKTGRNVFVTVNTMSPEMVKMIDVTRTTFRNAQSQLMAKGLQIGDTIYRAHIARDYVLEQLYKGKAIAPGKKIKKGERIMLVLGNGRMSNQNNEMPDLLGMTYEEAVQVIDAMGFDLGAVNSSTEAETSEDSALLLVKKQLPEYVEGRTYPSGTDVQLWIGE